MFLLVESDVSRGGCYLLHRWATSVGTHWGLPFHDWYGSYTSGVQVDPVGPGTGSARVFRGGVFGVHFKVIAT